MSSKKTYVNFFRKEEWWKVQSQKVSMGVKNLSSVVPVPIGQSNDTKDHDLEGCVPEPSFDPTELLKRFSQHDEKSLDSIYPKFTPDMAKEYKAWQRNSISVGHVVGIIVAIGTPSIGTRISLQWMGSAAENPLILSGQVLLLSVLTVAMGMYVFATVFLSFYGSSDSGSGQVMLSGRGRMMVDLCRKCLATCHLEDTICVISIICNALVLFGRVNAGQCPDVTDIWSSQLCNPEASCHSFPHDMVLMLYGNPLLCQVLFKGTSIYAVMTGYMLSIASVLYSLLAVDGRLQIYSVIYVIIFVTCSSEIERWMRISFVRHHVLEHIRTKTKEKELADQKRFADMEKDQMRNIMGNVVCFYFPFSIRLPC
jgi:hypothetical protein